LKEPPPVDFNSETIKFINYYDLMGFDSFETNIWKDSLHNKLWEDYYEQRKNKSYEKIKKYIETTKEYNTICGYKTTYLNKTKSIYINANNTGKKLWNQFKKLLNKYNFSELYYDIDFKISTNPFFEQPIVFSHPMYSFLSSICIFNLDYFFSPNKLIKSRKTSKNFNPKNFLKFYTEYITTLNETMINCKVDKLKLNKITKMLNNDKYNKNDIKEKLNSEKFNKKIDKEIMKMRKEMPLLIFYPGVIPRLKKHDDIFIERLLELDFAQNATIDKTEILKKAYPMYLDKINGYKYDKLVGKYPNARATINDNIKDFCDILNINKPK
ncbi:MAG: hypothetical protein ACOCWE_04220, partial [Bacillota bacterium]